MSIFNFKARIAVTLVLVLMIFMGAAVTMQVEAESLTLATTSSTEDSGLLGELLPVFEERTSYDVDVIAVGTGQALETGRRGDADVLLVHAPELEKEFVEDGYGTDRYYIMNNDFIIVGPADDPAGLAELDTTEEAMYAIKETGEAGELTFTSRGDGSGTHFQEEQLWQAAEIALEAEVEGRSWYNSLGQGMGPTLTAANEMGAYTLTDRGTFLSMQDELNNLEEIFAGPEELDNPYSIMPVNPETHDVDYEGALGLVKFFLERETQDMIGEFGVEDYGEPLFLPGLF
ncbi:substrate-binding domain-containing protein [Halarsenatibacter silvermanii]|uniref:Tungstate transport system substrate-binding protein n=1 Tax=Halarsenatibacter silvermanii TaxID=321763 RepID=A0A1G9TGJ4_9FIRM|nr:substrate-binding domain-containing protein [Halarsenatibacter silvermanii]SDM46732.1 tungstate transport system substrate-binding protein [Halarsenatibacter silvermanii]